MFFVLLVHLVWFPTNNFRNPFNLGEDRIGGGGPQERAGAAIVVGDIGVDALDQFLDVAEGPTADRLLGDAAEPALDLIDSASLLATS
jgi:hypothetical protein